MRPSKSYQPRTSRPIFTPEHDNDTGYPRRTSRVRISAGHDEMTGRIPYDSNVQLTKPRSNLVRKDRGMRERPNNSIHLDSNLMDSAIKLNQDVNVKVSKDRVKVGLTDTSNSPKKPKSPNDPKKSQAVSCECEGGGVTGKDLCYGRCFGQTPSSPQPCSGSCQSNLYGQVNTTIPPCKPANFGYDQMPRTYGSECDEKIHCACGGKIIDPKATDKKTTKKKKFKSTSASTDIEIPKLTKSGKTAAGEITRIGSLKPINEIKPISKGDIKLPGKIPKVKVSDKTILDPKDLNIDKIGSQNIKVGSDIDIKVPDKIPKVKVGDKTIVDRKDLNIDKIGSQTIKVGSDLDIKVPDKIPKVKVGDKTVVDRKDLNIDKIGSQNIKVGSDMDIKVPDKIPKVKVGDKTVLDPRDLTTDSKNIKPSSEGEIKLPDKSPKVKIDDKTTSESKDPSSPKDKDDDKTTSEPKDPSIPKTDSKSTDKPGAERKSSSKRKDKKSKVSLAPGAKKDSTSPRDQFTPKVGGDIPPDKKDSISSKGGRRKSRKGSPKKVPVKMGPPVKPVVKLSCGWIDHKSLMKLRSEMSVETSGFKACKRKRRPPPIDRSVELDFEEAIKYYTTKNPHLFKDLIDKSLEGTVYEEKPEKPEPTRMDRAKSIFQKLLPKSKPIEPEPPVEEREELCECPYGRIPPPLGYDPIPALPPRELAKYYPKRGLKLSVGGKGSLSPGLPDLFPLISRQQEACEY
uniref:SFRICE_039167 n=1 Tax=Spodoptera frugiperda TaxID=7108 RepID=A0A2H1WWF9_SPOFR